MSLERRRKPATRSTAQDRAAGALAESESSPSGQRRARGEQPDVEEQAIEQHRAASDDARREAAKRAAELLSRLRRL